MDGPLSVSHAEAEGPTARAQPRELAPPARGARFQGSLGTIAQNASARTQTPAESAIAQHPGRPVREIMTAKVVTFASTTTIEEATRVLLARHISGAPVVDEANRPIGIVSKTDLLEAWHEQSKEVAAAAAAGVEQPSAEATGVVVGDIMVPYLLAAQDSSPISLAAALMAYEGVHRLLVLDASSAMVGIVSSLDVLRWLAQLSGFCMERGELPRTRAHP